ncbi:DUF4282 domain-containing protein [Tomitella fengzijianii]|uniref:DUF4282 domain-containing protein n=1 Tax=Tomitella fengzijianii TaxID=2597660 RepID=A0A516X0R3_9ACTN|nr:DUF4282 domain-containing protein [Tomitella fengzijianii]QDQ96679.1 DUF4282 domain-containing protein [Tomitella fengzijianii]
MTMPPQGGSGQPPQGDFGGQPEGAYPAPGPGPYPTAAWGAGYPAGPQQPYPGPQQPYPGPQAQPADKGFFGALFDFDFEHVVTPRIVKIAYILAAVVIALLYFVFTVAAFSESVAGGFVVMLIVGPLIGLVYLVLARITLEFYRAIVVMGADIREMKNAQMRL